MRRMPTHKSLMLWGLSKYISLLMLSTAAVGVSLQGVALHVCSEVCSDGSCAPCDHDTQVNNQSTQGSSDPSGQGNGLTAKHTMTFTLSMRRPGQDEAVSRSSRQAPSPKSPPGNGTKPTMDELLTSLGIHPSQKPKPPSDKTTPSDMSPPSDNSNTYPGTEETLESPPTSTTNINAGDFLPNINPPREFSFGFLGLSNLHDTATTTTTSPTSPETNHIVSLIDPNKPRRPNSSPPIPGSVEETGWGSFLDMTPTDPKTEKDSVPNEKLERLETTTEDVQVETSSPRPVSAKTESSVERARVTGSLVLPDDAKKNLNLHTGPMNVGLPQPDPSPGVRTSGEAAESSTPGQGVTGPALSSVSPREDEKEEDGGRGGEKEEDEEQLHGIQIILLVAPCVGALLSVIGAVCVVRTAASNCCRRQKRIEEGRHQQNQTNHTQPTSSRHRTAHLSSERDIERNDRRSH